MASMAAEAYGMAHVQVVALHMVARGCGPVLVCTVAAMHVHLVALLHGSVAHLPQCMCNELCGCMLQHGEPTGVDVFLLHGCTVTGRHGHHVICCSIR